MLLLSQTTIPGPVKSQKPDSLIGLAGACLGRAESHQPRWR